MALNQDQYNQVKNQLEKHQRESGIRTMVLDEKRKVVLKLFIEKGVFGSDIMSSGIYLAKFLYTHPQLYRGKDVLDLGCGSGTQGIVMLKQGAKTAAFSDISQKAINNVQKNLELHHIKGAAVYHGDLFENVPHKYDVIVFNHPFFPEEAENFKDDPNKDPMLRKSVLGGTELIKRFFQQVSAYLGKDGVIVMPYFLFAGPENDPVTHAKKYGFDIQAEEKIESDHGLQRGDFSIYIIKKQEA